jgi:DNA invertase Pin-like site-specific DNA recombinase
MNKKKQGRKTARQEPRLIGYARVSTGEQHLDLQLDALAAAGCQRIYRDNGVSGVAAKRPGLTKALRALRAGDVLVVWKLDRFGRSLAELIAIMGQLERRDIGFRSLSESIDTTTAGGRLVFHLMGALAEFERGLISERTKAGMASAKARGAKIGRPPKLTKAQVAKARRKIDSGKASAAELAREYDVSALTLARALKAERPAK